MNSTDDGFWGAVREGGGLWQWNGKLKYAEHNLKKIVFSISFTYFICHSLHANLLLAELIISRDTTQNNHTDVLLMYI
jgi:hypothetical protein